MPDIQRTVQQLEHRLGEVSREVLRIESHLRRGEFRAAKARIGGARMQVEGLKTDRSAVMQTTLVGAQLGLLSGGHWLRGRLPAAILLGLGGWMVGQSLLDRQVREIEEVINHLDFLEAQIEAGTSPQPTPVSETTST